MLSIILKSSDKAAFYRFGRKSVFLFEFSSKVLRRSIAEHFSDLFDRIRMTLQQTFRSTPDRYMWLRNSVFHSLGMRHYDEKLAKEMIHAMFDLQQPDGLIPHRRFTLYIPLLHSAAGSFAGNENTQRNGSRSVSMVCPNPGIFRLKANNFQYQLKTTLCPPGKRTAAVGTERFYYH